SPPPPPAPAPSVPSPLSLHAALPILNCPGRASHPGRGTALVGLLVPGRTARVRSGDRSVPTGRDRAVPGAVRGGREGRPPPQARSEEHTSELQSRFDLVCRLLLAKQK